jgi:S-(hydroxymethyl)glutathione dehydrogenase / alcohol dehydrogenase
MKKIKAAILVKQKEPLVVDYIQLPEQLQYGQVLVKIFYSSICGAQINEIEGVKGPDKFLPHLLGHEAGAEVMKVGPGVNVVKPGDHVVMHWRQGNGIHSATPTYDWNGQKVNAGWVTTFCEYAVVSENRVTAIPKDFNLKEAALYGCAITTAFGVIANDSQLKCGESIVIFGSGGVGMAIILAAKAAGANPIIAIDINEYKLNAAKKSGATHIINSSKQDVAKTILEILPKGSDVIVDTTGIKTVREQAYELTSKEGRTVFVGVPKAGEKITIDSFPLHFEKKITGSHGGDANPSYDIPRLIALQQSGAFELSHMISHEFTLDKINDAIELLKHGNALRIIIKMEHKE